LNWQLIFAPKSVLEYAVVHELCHLQYRNHSPEFWIKVKEVLPDYELRKNWLDRNEHSLETSQLGIEGSVI
jgi:predicted metal-dependent hydrolase